MKTVCVCVCVVFFFFFLTATLSSEPNVFQSTFSFCKCEQFLYFYHKAQKLLFSEKTCAGKQLHLRILNHFVSLFFSSVSQVSATDHTCDVQAS